MGQGVLVWFVITLLPGGETEMKPYHFERSCQAVAAAYQRQNERNATGRQSFCRQASPGELAAAYPLN